MEDLVSIITNILQMLMTFVPGIVLFIVEQRSVNYETLD